MRTPLYDEHVKCGARISTFAGWDMSLYYGSQIEEHMYVRKHSGIFDTSHMNIVDISGEDSETFLRYLIANDVKKIYNTKAIYSCLLNDNGCVIDDLIVYRISQTEFRIISNAATKDKDIKWIKKHASSYGIDMKVLNDFAMIAIQGPKAVEIFCSTLSKERSEICDKLNRFHCAKFNDMFVGRTGYTGEDGFEIVIDKSSAVQIWNKLIGLGCKPIGLVARDSLRLEAGMSLYGSEMDETKTPLESNLAWTVDFNDSDRDFIGKKALEKQKANGIKENIYGIILEDKGILRSHQKVFTSHGIGETTSGGFSPMLGKAIAIARIPVCDDEFCQVEMRDKKLKAKIIKLPFIKTV